jgi:hypothetical protein
MIDALNAPQIIPVRTAPSMTTGSGMPASESRTATRLAVINVAGWLRSMKPPEIATSPWPMARTPTTAMVKVTASTVWCEKKSGR